MDSADATATATANAAAVSSSSSSSPPPAAVIVSPCAACKILRRRCAERCVLAPYFPPSDPLKFSIAHRVFGASNIIKLLQELPEAQRADAVSSMVYEANTRIRDPVYGCAGVVCQLQKQIDDLQAQLAQSRAQLVSVRCQQTELLTQIYKHMGQTTRSMLPSSPPSTVSSPESAISAGIFTNGNPSCFIDDTGLGSIWEPLWA